MIISVLISVYNKENAQFLNESFESLYNQTRPAEEIICIKDGELSAELNQVLEKWKRLLPLKVYGYEKNMGLAYALSFGIQYCSGDYIVRMDSDDISVKDRIEKQVEFINANPDVVLFSSYISEFFDDPDKINYIKELPIKHEDIFKYSLKRNPFNHMAVCFNKKAIIASGGYQDVPFFEDYDLWVRVLRKNYLTANIPEVLVKARIGNDMVGRRHGLSYAKKELFFLKRQYQSGYITKCQYFKLFFLRIPIRLLPKKMLSIIYSLLRVKPANL